MPYLIAHPFSSGQWVIKQEDGSYAWGPYEKKEKFQNWFKAKAAYDTVKVFGMYNDLKTPHYMKVS